MDYDTVTTGKSRFTFKFDISFKFSILKLLTIYNVPVK